MSNKDEILKVVAIEIPKGGVCQGTKVKLSNGQYLTGIHSISLRGDTESQLWSLSLDMVPDFMDQQTLEAVLANVEMVKRQSTPNLIHNIENQIADLQGKLEWLKGLDNETTQTAKQTTGDDTEGTETT
ncbi:MULTISPECIES: hypothetical protein [unclassified Acinetobacter]|uniref:hypothetical protein n=1 Tax=unclassified Acinetobacter TaxID=196816 RepID=UPI0015D143DD|nr:MULTISPECIES: hypothetical protein [unclassified Acinetobacter]